MLMKTLGIAVLLGTAGAFAVGIAPAESVAGMIYGTTPTVQMAPDTNLESVAFVKKKVVIKRKKTKHGVVTTKRTVWAYNSKKHGHRYRYRTGPNRYYYGGYYYQRPWWTVSSPVIHLCIGC